MKTVEKYMYNRKHQFSLFRIKLVSKIKIYQCVSNVCEVFKSAPYSFKVCIFNTQKSVKVELVSEPFPGQGGPALSARKSEHHLSDANLQLIVCNEHSAMVKGIQLQ